MEPNISAADCLQLLVAFRVLDRVANGGISVATVHDAMAGRVTERDRKFSGASSHLSEDGILDKKIDALILNRHVFGIFSERLRNAPNHRAREHVFLIAARNPWIDLHEMVQLFWQVRNLYKAISNLRSTKPSNREASIVVRWDGKCERQGNVRDCTYLSSSVHIVSRRKEKRPAAYLNSRKPTANRWQLWVGGYVHFSGCHIIVKSIILAD